MEEKYHVVVTLAYFVIIAIIISVLQEPRWRSESWSGRLRPFFSPAFCA